MRICGVYFIKNNITQKVYVGSSIDIFTRWKSHKYKLLNNLHHSTKLQNSYNKYGKDVFEYCLAESAVDRKRASELEQKWIDKMNAVNNGYNVNPFAENVGLLPKTQEHKNKIGQAHLGRKLSEESKEKIRQAARLRKRNPLSEEHKRKISEIKKGKSYMTEEGKKKLSAFRKSMTGKIKMSDEAKRNMSIAKVEQFRNKLRFLA